MSKTNHSMRTFLFFFAAITFLSSCSSVVKEVPCIPPPKAVLFRFVSSSGTDLLNPSRSGAYDTTKIKMSTNDLPVEYKVLVRSNIGKDSFFLSSIIYGNWENATAYYIKFPGGDIDTINTTQIETSRDCYEFGIVSLKYNGIALTPGFLVNTIHGPVSGYTVIK